MWRDTYDLSSLVIKTAPINDSTALVRVYPNLVLELMHCTNPKDIPSKRMGLLNSYRETENKQDDSTEAVLDGAEPYLPLLKSSVRSVTVADAPAIVHDLGSYII